MKITAVPCRVGRIHRGARIPALVSAPFTRGLTRVNPSALRPRQPASQGWSADELGAAPHYYSLLALRPYSAPGTLGSHPTQKGFVPKVELVIPHLATLSVLGKSVGFGLALGLAAFGSAIGIGLIFSSVISSTARQPEAKNDLQPLMWIGFAVTEAITFFGLFGGLMLIFLV
jgi:F-type H+-transporting ATPase subunit c